jgi:hypothetical protein
VIYSRDAAITSNCCGSLHRVLSFNNTPRTQPCSSVARRSA